jgi:hypothetical protein
VPEYEALDVLISGDLATGEITVAFPEALIRMPVSDAAVLAERIIQVTCELKRRCRVEPVAPGVVVN